MNSHLQAADESLDRIAPHAFLTSHAGAPVEWWFVQGRLRIGNSDDRSFMFAFFRYNLAGSGQAPRHAHSLLYSELEAGSGRHAYRNWIDNAMWDETLEGLRQERGLMDKPLRDTLLEELQGGRPLEPIERRSNPPHMIESPIRIQWDGFTLGASCDGRLDLVIPGSDTSTGATLRLTPRSGHQSIRCGPVSDDGRPAMEYRVCPRWSLEGLSAAGAPLRGDAWVEHQWGNNGWVYLDEGDRSRSLSWDWMGWNLDNGCDILVAVHRDAKTREILHRHATWFEADGSTRSADDVDLQPLREWTSPLTYIRYPVAWRVQIPSFDLDATFHPLADDQQIQTFEPARAIWEGAGIVTGTAAGQPLRGHARLELHGYGNIFDYDEFLSEATSGVDRALRSFLPARFTEADAARFAGAPGWRHDPDGLTEAIARPAWDLLNRKGKRWRPLFGHFLLRAMGGDGEKYDDLISVVAELIHSGALIIDDVEDGSERRRGEPCIHLRYGTDIAINLGSALYFLPAVSLMEQADLSMAQRLRLHEIKERVCIEAHCGQALDLHWSRHLTRERLGEWMSNGFEDRLLQMYDLKTGAGTRGVALSAAVLASADGETAAVAERFARAYAVAFQIVDDIHNFSLSPAWTKTAGEDISNGKPTYVIVTALRRLPADARDRLADLLCDPARRSTPEGRAEGMEWVRASGALEACRNEALRLTADGWEPLAARLPPTESKILLRAMCRKMLQFMYES